ncbi:alpha/beta fold hydrolase [Alkalibacillus salilacus]|uniref:Pimeloyl-ACP methyl ester carboxylesterase n=1 Tax=Alkalibacillus salilacus TaxID=284582 RepID=A0ABT9VF09_9BACI|nr:alpha/beta hydrolase [Alkalibacillus salilacus]MDQ0159552.1 pimeloyl-ACP methyl ester carboxylesterase [Alkalibacillus salilacus]
MLLDYKIYQHDSSQEWVVFLHGVGGNHTIFYKQAKQFKKNYNCLFINFPGHGKSKPLDAKYTTRNIADKVLEVLDHLNLRKAHFIGISLGSMVMTEIGHKMPDRVASMTMGGAVVKWKFWTDMLFKIAYRVRSFVPYMVLYKFFARILMPKKNHKDSRTTFVNEASKLGQREFVRWTELLTVSKSLYKRFLSMPKQIPKLYLMGDEDHVFLKGAQFAADRDPNASLQIIDDSGHVCNIDQANQFNDYTISFIEKHMDDGAKNIDEKYTENITIA